MGSHALRQLPTTSNASQQRELGSCLAGLTTRNAQYTFFPSSFFLFMFVQFILCVWSVLQIVVTSSFNTVRNVYLIRRAGKAV